MSESAQAETQQPKMVDTENAQLPQAIAEQVTKAGIPTTPREVIPDPLHVLEGTGELIDAAVYSLGKDAQTAFAGKESDTYDRTIPAKGVRSWVLDRLRRLNGSNTK